MEILRDDAICEWKKLLGPANSGLARTDAPGSIRAVFGTDGIRNAAHGPDSLSCAARVRRFKNILILVLFLNVDIKVKHFVTAEVGQIYSADVGVEKTLTFCLGLNCVSVIHLLSELVTWLWSE